MPITDRREFLRQWAASFGAVALPGCGGGGGPDALTEVQGATGANTAQPAALGVTLPLPTTSAPLFAVSLLPTKTLTEAPFCLGVTFKAGDMPAGNEAVSGQARLQTSVKNRWPDGSARLAVLCGSANVTAGSELKFSVSRATAPVSPPEGIRVTTLSDSSLDITISAGPFGSARWARSDWASPHATWISGPRMSSWIYRRPIGADAHLVAWLEVRRFANGAIEVLPWVENGYLMVPGPTSKKAVFEFAINGTSRFSREIDLPHHCRTPLLEGTQLSHWVSDSPDVIACQDRQYLQSTEMVPFYAAQVPAGSSLLNTLPTSFVPLQLGSYANAMGQTGYHPAIGLLPQWDALFLTSDDRRTTYRALMRNAFSAGRYPIHYRDETTQRPLRFSRHPHLSVNSSSKMQFPPAPSGTKAPAWDIPHHPSIGYMAFLASGFHYCLEELQFGATYNFLCQVDNRRQFTQGVFLSSSGAATVRGAAWAVRTLAQAAVATPDDDLLQAELLSSLTANIEFNHATYVAQSNNPFGFVAPYGDTYGTGSDGRVTEAPWQQDFYTAAFGYALAMKPNVGNAATAKLREFFAWKAQSVIGRLGGTSANEWLYRDAAVYQFVVALVDNPDWMSGKGPWAANWGELYKASFGVTNPGVSGGLRGGNFPEATSYWGNLLPAISYAVRHGVPGASAAMARITGADNWSSFAARVNSSPEWSVWSSPTNKSTLPVVIVPPPAPSPSPAPAPTPSPAPDPSVRPGSPADSPPPPAARTPAWAQGLRLWAWTEIPGTALSSVEPTPRPLGSNGPRSKIEAWCGATLKRNGSVYMLGAAGGHADYAGNEVNALDLLADRPAWVELRGPSSNADIIDGVQFYLDKRPSATHTYYATQFIDRLNRMVVFASPGAHGVFPPAPAGYPLVGASRSYSFDLSKNEWDAPDYIAQMPESGDTLACLCVRHPLTGDVYYSRNYSSSWYRWTSTANRWDRLSGTSRAPWYAGSAIDTVRNRMLVVGGYSPTAPLMLDLNGQALSVQFGGLGAGALAVNGYPGVVYDELNDLYVVAFNSSGTIRILTVRAADFHVSDPNVSGASPAARPNGIQNAIQYVPQLKGVVIANRYNGNVYFMRTA